MLISDCRRWGAPLVLERTRELCAAAAPGSVVVQLRDRELSARERLRLGEQLLKAAHDAGQKLIVNERLDLALMLGADGVHLPEAAVAPELAREFLSAHGCEQPWLSSALHDVDAPLSAALDGVLLSPILSPRKGRAALGPSALATVRRRLGATQLLFALGGVDAQGVRPCLEAGANGVAVIGAAFSQPPRPLLLALGVARSGSGAG